MYKVALVLVCALAAALTPAIGRADKVYAVGKGGTWDCKNDPVVSINHGRGTYTFQGPCRAINLNGGGSTITIESVDDLNINGAGNTVTVGEVDHINLVGSSNKVTYKRAKHGDKPSVNMVGTNNQVEAGGGGADKPADKPAEKPADKPAGKPVPSNAVDCGKEPSHVINNGDVTVAYVGACDRIVINGGDNHVTIESVKSIAINGSENVVDIGAADRIAINGDENKVTYKKGLSSAKPKISSLGGHNSTTQVK